MWNLRIGGEVVSSSEVFENKNEREDNFSLVLERYSEGEGAEERSNFVDFIIESKLD